MLCANNSTYTIHYGETVNIYVSGADSAATTGTFYVSKPGDAPVISKEFTLNGGSGNITLTDVETSIALGEYIYSIVINGIEYPSGDLPKFTVLESAKYTEV